MRIHTLLLFIGILLCHPLASQVVVDGADPFTPLGIALRCAPDLNYQADKVIHGKYDYLFTEPFSPDAFPAGNSSWWLYFQVENPTDEPLKLILATSHFDFLKCYIPNRSGEYDVQFSGRKYPNAKKARLLGPYSYADIMLPPRTKRKVYIQAQYEGRHSFEHQIFPMEFGLMTESYWKEKEQLQTYGFVAFCGAVLIMFLYNLALFTITKDKNYVIYSFYSLGMLGLTYIYSGLWVEQQHNLTLQDQVNTSVACVTMMLYVVFVRQVLPLKKYYPRVDKAMLGALGYIVLYFTLATFFYWESLAFTVAVSGIVYLGTFIAVLVVSAKLYLKHNFMPAKYFFIGQSLYLLFIILSAIRMAGIGSYAAWGHAEPHTLTMVGIVMELSLFSLSLGAKINAYQQQLAAEQLAAEQMRREEEEKRNRLIAEQNVMLERKVNERTLALQEANAELQSQQDEILAQRDAIELEKEQSERLLLNILPEEVAWELKNTGVAKPKQYEQVSVLFTDFKNFTGIAEQMSAEELLENLNYCFGHLDTICMRYGLEKIKTIGDAYMAVCGLPDANPKHAFNAVKAAIEMQQFMDEWMEAKKEASQIVWAMRVGVNSGAVTAGVVGKHKFAYDIWGDTVNTAARMEQECEAGKVNISASTYALVSDYFKCIYRGKISAKNKGEIDMYYVEGK